jgi:hypothetical protein
VACSVGTLQKLGYNVMYQAGLHDNPQMDVQGAQRIIRTGQTEQHSYLYRVMIDGFAEKTKLQR